MNIEDLENVAYYDALASHYHLFFSDLRGSMEQEGAWLTSVLLCYSVRKVLDASCGAGRQSVPLCKQGFDLTAADPSTAMLHQARMTAREHGVTFPVLNAGFADLSSYFHGAFDAVIALGNGLCNQERVEEVESALRSMHACCRPGGVCLIGIKDFEAITRDREMFHGHRIVDRDGVRTILFEAWEIADRTLVSTAYLISHPHQDRPATVKWARTREYMLYEPELRSLAQTVGFTSVRRLDHPNEAVFALTK